MNPEIDCAANCHLRQKIIDHIMRIKKVDEEYARWALRFYNELLPELELNSGVREAIEKQIKEK